MNILLPSPPFLVVLQGLFKKFAGTMPSRLVSVPRSLCRVVLLWLSFQYLVNCTAFLEVRPTRRHQQQQQTLECSRESSVEKAASTTATSTLASIDKETSSFAATSTMGTSDCQFCHASFSSRNALFRHLKSTPDCATKAGMVVVDHHQQIHSIQGILFGRD